MKLKKFDVIGFLDNDEALIEYLNVALEENDPKYFAKALGNVARAKGLTSKPVVAVGRFTSPDTMARHIRNGTQDLIGAARPSIAAGRSPSGAAAAGAVDSAGRSPG